MKVDPMWVSLLSEDLLQTPKSQAQKNHGAWICKIKEIEEKLATKKKIGVPLNEVSSLIAAIKATRISRNLLEGDFLLKNMQQSWIKNQ